MKEYHTYVILLPSVYHDDLRDITSPEVVRSISYDGAISKAISRKVNKSLVGKVKSVAIGEVMNNLKNNYGNMEKFAHEIPLQLEDEKGVLIDPTSSSYRELQEIFVAQEIREKTGKNKIYSLRNAKSVLNSFYSSSFVI